MSLPDFNVSGDLPVGIHNASLAEMTTRFANDSTRRKMLVLRLQRIYRIAVQTGCLARFVVFGSFVTSKPEPNDVDVYLIMDDNFDVGQMRGEPALLFDHSTAQTHFGCSVFWVRRMAALGGELASIADWQIKRDGTRRGIVQITGE